MSMSIVDLMSSPDPLIEESLAPVPPSSASRRITRSHASTQRFFALGSSPRKQTFALDVGNDISPRRVLVTVEADDQADNTMMSSSSRNVNRKLFQSPTPRSILKRMEKHTTTRVPVRGLTDDEIALPSDPAEAIATPRRRGRPPKSSNGTPATTSTAARRKRPGTPGGAKAQALRKDMLTSDISVPDNEATPKASARRSTKRKVSAPARTESGQGSLPRKRGRPSRQSILAREENVAQPIEGKSAAGADVEDNASVAGNQQRPPSDHGAGGDEDVEEDIWLAGVTPVVRRWQPQRRQEEDLIDMDEPVLPEQPATQPQEAPRSEPDHAQEEDEGYMDFGGMESHSEAESAESENLGSHDREDTVGAGEEFTMISLNSLPSMQQLNSSMMQSQRLGSSVMAPQPQEEEEIGEATSLIIHSALESLRQSQNQSAREASLAEPSTTAEDRREAPEAERSTQQQRLEEEEQEQQRAVLEAEEGPSMFSQPKSSPQAWWNRSPKRTRTKQSLGKQLAVKSLHREDGRRSSPERPSASNPAPIQENPDTSMYEDSFSEIPEAVLAAATPGRIRRPQAATEPEYEEEEELPEQEAQQEEMQGAGEQLQQEEAEQGMNIQPSIERPSTVNHSNPQSEANRLLTPDETPSPSQTQTQTQTRPDGEEEPQTQTNKSRRTTIPATSDYDDLRSSPPAIGISAPSPSRHSAEDPIVRRGHTRTQSLETPAEQRRSASYVSPAAAGPNAAQANYLAPPETHSQRPTLSPIVRAGRALQLVTSDPPSPPGRDSVLRSPFRGSASKSSQSPVVSTFQQSQAALPTQAQDASPTPVRQAPSTRQSWFAAPLSQVRNLVVQGAASVFSSPRHINTSVAGMEDPFGPTQTPRTGLSSVLRRSTLANNPAAAPHGQVQEPNASAGMNFGSSRANPPAHSDAYDAMSWRGESPVRVTTQQNRPPTRSSSTEAERGSSASEEMEIDRSSQHGRAEEPEMEAGMDADMDADMDEVAHNEELEQNQREYEMESEHQQQEEELADYEEEQAAFEEQQEENPEEQEEEEQEYEEEEDDDDIWAIEAQRPTPFGAKAKAPVFNPPRRGKLPSPWRKNSRRLAYSDELRSELPSPSGDELAQNAPINEPAEEEYSLLSRQSRQGQAAPATKQNPTPAPAPATKKMDLSAFFSPPAPLPEVQVPLHAQNPAGFGPSRAPDARKENRPPQPQTRPQESQDMRVASLVQAAKARLSTAQTSLGATQRQQQPQPLWVTQREEPVAQRRRPLIPESSSPPRPQPRLLQTQKQLPSAPRDDEPPVRRIRPLFAETSSPSPPRQQPQPRLLQPQSQKLPSVPQKHLELTPGHRRRDLFSPVREVAVGESAPIHHHHQSSSPTTPERSSFTHVPQKQNFTPRPRQSGRNTLFAPDLSGPVNSLFARNPPPLEEEGDVPRHREMSPAKSCMRSPLKPKTPGRVVEFTSSTLSPLAQAQARAEREQREQQQQNTTTTASLSPDLEEEEVRPRVVVMEADKEDRVEERSSSSPVMKMKTNMPLSNTHWTRDHWVRLDEFLQLRRKCNGTLQFQMHLQRISSKYTSQKEVGSSSRRWLLGKMVTAQGEQMVLEQWHLDVVDAFRAEVGGGGSRSCWSEDVLAKRLFALLVGERRRAERRVNRSSRRRMERAMMGVRA